jgi:hypothetical protein
MPCGNSIHGKTRLKTLSGGEEYCVCCPECGDKRFRLWINHRYKTEYQGQVMHYLARCHNENCEKNNPGFWKRLHQRITAGGAGLTQHLYVEDPDPEELKLTPTPLPGVCEPLHVLKRKDPRHLAVRYVESRGFAAEELGEVWGVSFCEYSNVLPKENRLVFPVYDYYEGKLMTMNWQARYLTEEVAAAAAAGVKEDPIIKKYGGRKYYNAPGSKLKWLLYNGWRAREHNSLVIIGEGAFDVCRAGPNCGVGLFGKSISELQRTALWEHWGSKGAIGVIGLDPDAEKERAALKEQMGNWSMVIDLKLPPDTDIGEMDRSELAARIRSHL